jgi:glycosyltransferase involved in cell wall biosynthesis
MKKIAWILHGNYVNEGRVYKESQTLSKAGYEVRLYATWKHGLARHEFEGSVEIIRIDLPVLRLLKVPLYRAKLFMPFYSLKLILLVRNYNPDILHCMNFWTLHIGFIYKLFFRKPFLYDSHDLFLGQNHFNTGLRKVRFIYKLLEHFFAKQAVSTFQTTNARQFAFKQEHGIDSCVIMNKSFKPEVKKSVLNSQDYPKLASTKLKLVYVGSIQFDRGIEEVISFIKNNDNIDFFLLGNPNGAWGRSFLESNKNYLTWIPAVPPEDVTCALQSFDLGITLIQNTCDSYYRCCPTKMWELIAAGVPQIASDFPEIRRVLVGDENNPMGWVIDPGNKEILQEVLTDVIRNPQKINLIKKNLAKVNDDFTWCHEAKKLLFIYKSLI